jgi:tetratricopeptide (TPR) repeat protein
LALAEVYLQQDRLDEAEWHFRQVLQNDPANARAHLGLGRLAYQRGNLSDSLAHLQRSAANKRTQKASRIVLAQVYQQQGDTAAAGKEQARAAGLPNDPVWPDPFVDEIWSLRVGKQARLARLTALRQQGRVAEIRSFAAKLEDDYPDVYWLVEGRLQMDQGNLAAAEQALRKAIELEPRSVDAHFDLGTTLFKEKNYRAAADCFQKVTQLEAAYGPAYQSLGRCWALLGNRAEAIRALQAAVQLMPQNSETRRDLAALLVQDGRAEEAMVQLRQVLHLQPDDAEAKRLLEQIPKS